VVRSTIDLVSRLAATPSVGISAFFVQLPDDNSCFPLHKWPVPCWSLERTMVGDNVHRAAVAMNLITFLSTFLESLLHIYKNML
jgi:hypothetical protein